MAPAGAGGFFRSLSQRLTGNKAKQRRPPPSLATATAAPIATSGAATSNEQQHHHHQQQQQQQQQCASTSQQQQQTIVAAAAAAATNLGGVAAVGRHFCQCRVQLLDRTYVDVVLPKNAMAKELYERVFAHMELDERDYFGLQFTDHFHVHHWLDPTKKIRKQMSIGPPYTFRFRVKFFSSEPANLREELTRYQFFLQLRHDIQTGQLDCSREAVVNLAALALQSEFGDFNPKEHSMEFVSEFRFHPAQDEYMERDILHSYATKWGGMSPSQAELAFLNSARLLDFYGVDMHPVEGRDGNTYRLGLTPVGMQVFDGRQKIGLFVWEKIQRLDFRGRKLTLVVEEDLEQPKCVGQLVQLHTFVFELSSHKACKHLWKCAIEYHTFYRLKFHHRHAGRSSRVQLFRLGSTFRHRGRTEYEALHRDEFTAGRCAIVAHPSAAAGGPISSGRSGGGTDQQQLQFTRRPSQRYAPRHRLATTTAAATRISQPSQQHHHRQQQQQQVLLTMPEASLTKCQKGMPTMTTTMPSTKNDGSTPAGGAGAFANGGTAAVSSAAGFGDSSPCRASAIPVPSSSLCNSFSASANSALKKSGAYDNSAGVTVGFNGGPGASANNNNNNEYVTTIQISRGGKEKQQQQRLLSTQQQRQQPNAGEGGNKCAAAVSRIPSLITLPAASSSSVCQPNSTKFVVTNTNSTTVGPPLPPSHHQQQRKCTQIPVIRTPSSRMVASSSMLLTTDHRGMATEL